jgi:malate dehydrogenase (quinone)
MAQKITKSIKPVDKHSDIVLMGAGIMSATLGIILKELDPSLTIQIFERLDEAGMESSDAWHNAGTGHAAFCELNYTPEKDGKVECAKAVKISEQFELSREFWSYLVEKGYASKPSSFINRVPHMSLVWGDTNVGFLRNRYAAMRVSPLFKDMVWSEDREQIAGWAPIVMDGRGTDQPLAATRMEIGTDVDFGTLTRAMVRALSKMPGVHIHYNAEALDLDPDGKGGWNVFVMNRLNDHKEKTNTKFVFIGAGGATLHLLKRAEIEERKGFGGFPVGGLWLKCLNPDVIKHHHAKVYGKATVGSPPMSVPHVDTRMINGNKELLFGPFAAFSTKFLKNGSMMDLPKSIKFDNMIPMVFAGLKNMPLTRYLIDQLRLNHEDRVNSLREYVPSAKMSDWQLLEAGQRVQVIKKDKVQGGVLEFGTEMVVAKDGTVAALLGASPGASTAAAVMFSLVKRCFPKQFDTPAWQEKLRAMVPSFGQPLAKDVGALEASRNRTARVLGL